jgi:hypothetical protein
MTDSENDTHLSDAELYAALTSAVAETWDTVMASGVGDEYVKSVVFNTVNGQKEYPLNTIVSAGDFYKINTLYVDEGNGQLRAIPRINPYEEQAYRAPAAAVPMKLYYTPCAPGVDTGAESFDGINGWEEHTLNLACAFIKEKKSDDASPYRSRAREIAQRIQTMANRSIGSLLGSCASDGLPSMTGMSPGETTFHAGTFVGRTWSCSTSTGITTNEVYRH